MTSPNVPTGGGTSATGLPQNLAGALAYILGPITGILFLVVEKENRFVRFHAMQSTVVSLAWFVASFALSFLTSMPLVGWIFALAASLFGLVGLAVCLFMMWKAFQNEEWEFPVLGAFARSQLAGAA
jgi:uncharacterized membrane protein